MPRGAKKGPKKPREIILKDEPQKAKRVGRPTAIDEGSIKFAVYLLRNGATQDEVARELGISRSTLAKWKLKYPKIKDAMDNAVAAFDDNVVVDALFKRATGYEHKETKMFCHEGMIIAEDCVKHYPPDTKAIEFWLSNRQPDKWSRKIAIENDLSKLDDTKLIELAKDILKEVDNLENTDAD